MREIACCAPHFTKLLYVNQISTFFFKLRSNISPVVTQDRKLEDICCYFALFIGLVLGFVYPVCGLWLPRQLGLMDAPSWITDSSKKDSRKKNLCCTWCEKVLVFEFSTYWKRKKKREDFAEKSQVTLV